MKGLSRAFPFKLLLSDSTKNKILPLLHNSSMVHQIMPIFSALNAATN